MKSTQKIEWTKELSVGNESVDNDHKKLLDVFNRLIEYINVEKSKTEFSEILSQLNDYVLSHFKNEELYMEEFKYPNLTEHKKLHVDFSFKVAQYNIDLKKDNPPKPAEVVEFIKKWLTNHIMITDAAYEKFKSSVQSDARYKPF